MQGTLEFVSTRFLRNVNSQFKIEEWDDLESFMWVALYVMAAVTDCIGAIFPSSLSETPESIDGRRCEFVRKTERPSTMFQAVSSSLPKHVDRKKLVVELEDTLQIYRSFCAVGNNATQLTVADVRKTIKTFVKLVEFAPQPVI